MQTIRIATRESALALWQARFAAAELERANPGLSTELVPMTTRGDQLLDRPLAEIGGKGLFLKELEHALMEGRADIAVHSMKDVPAEMPPGLEVPVILARHDPRDALVSARYGALEELAEDACVGTSSLRRQAQLKRRFPGLDVQPLRGNVNTRLGKLDDGQYDAIILAAAGLDRLEMSDRIRQRIDPALSLPAVAQGAIGIECRDNDPDVRRLIDPLNDLHTAMMVTAEREVSARLGGSCQVPLAAHAQISNGQLSLAALVAMPDGSEVIEHAADGPAEQAREIGAVVAQALLEGGARGILERL